MGLFNFSPENSERSERKTVTLTKDTQVFRRTRAGSGAAHVVGMLESGEQIEIGSAKDVVTLTYDHQRHEFIPWEDEPDDSQADGIGYIMTRDLPADW